MFRYSFNARFLMRKATGVDRVATELISSTLSAGLSDRKDDAILLRPKGEIVSERERPKILLANTHATKIGLSGHLWEQLELPSETQSDLLISLCNIGPLRHKNHVVMMHDAQAFRQPEAYSRAFRTLYQFIQPRLGHKARRILTVSEHSKRELEHFNIVPKDKAIVVPNGADHVLRLESDTKILERHGLESDGYFLALGSLAPHKNLKMLIDAANERRDRSLPLVIAGGGNESVFSNNGLNPSEHVKMLGRVSDSELRALYEGARALLFPSLTEGFGLPPAEAMTLGCPVIASTGGAIPEVTADAAINLSPNESTPWTEAMNLIQRNSSLRQELVEKGRERSEKFTWAKSADKFMNILDGIPEF